MITYEEMVDQVKASSWMLEMRFGPPKTIHLFDCTGKRLNSVLNLYWSERYQLVNANLFSPHLLLWWFIHPEDVDKIPGPDQAVEWAASKAFFIRKIVSQEELEQRDAES